MIGIVSLRQCGKGMGVVILLDPNRKEKTKEQDAR